MTSGIQTAKPRGENKAHDGLIDVPYFETLALFSQETVSEDINLRGALSTLLSFEVPNTLTCMKKRHAYNMRLFNFRGTYHRFCYWGLRHRLTRILSRH